MHELLALVILLFTHASSVAVADSIAPAPLKDLGPAPAFVRLENWINSSPLELSQLRGKVVLVEFWTYSCINCLRTLRHLKTWHRTYAERGLVVIGVHAPEYAFERSLRNLKLAVRRHDIEYPVVQDNAFGTWNAYRNEYWPAVYLIDRNGRLVLRHVGENGYQHIEAALLWLLASPADSSAKLTHPLSIRQ